MAARVSGATTACGVTREGLVAAALIIEPASGIAILTNQRPVESQT
jgi:hypothetical protein